MDFRVISIGTLATHPLWNEAAAVRTGHATTTLIRSGKAVIIVDPALPEAVLAARLSERAGLKIRDVTHVFMTCFRPDVRRGLSAFGHATWWINHAERESVGVPLVGDLQKAVADEDDALVRQLQEEVALLKRCESAPDRLAPGVDLFPLPGVTPGLAGLVLAGPRETVVVCGDAIPTVEHLERGMVLTTAVDVARARESFGEAVEIADALVLGRDNFVINPVKRAF